MQQTVYTVTGMTCGHCVNAVRAEIARIPGVREVTVDLASGAVTLGADSDPGRAAIQAAVAEAGYELAG